MQGLSSYSYCLEIFVAIFMYMLWLKKRERFALRVVVSLFVLFLAAIFINPIFSRGVEYLTLLWFFSVYLIDIGICFYCCDVSIWDAVLAVSLGYAVQHLTSSVYLLVIYEGREPQWQGAFYIGIYAAIYLLCYFAAVRGITDNGRLDAGVQRSLIAAAIIVSTTMILSFSVKYSAEQVNRESSGIAYYSMFRYCQIYSILVCVFLIWNTRVQQREIRYKEKLAVNQALWKQRQQQFQTSKDNIDAINRKCHDLKHQIAALASEQSGAENKKKYIREMQDMIEVYDTAVETGNEALDTLLMERGLFCHMHGIDWTCVADGSWLSFMDVVDLYTLLGNALDNAQEATLQIDDRAKRMIAVRIWKQGAFVVIRVENSFAGSVQIKDGKLLTSKADKENHGFGTRSIRRIAEEYGGTVSFKTEEQIFLLNILIPIKMSTI